MFWWGHGLLVLGVVLVGLFVLAGLVDLGVVLGLILSMLMILGVDAYPWC